MLACSVAPLALGGAVGAGLLTPTVALAQAQPAAAPASAAPQGTELGEVIVTARRRQENLARVPNTITAFNSQQLAERSVHNENDLQLVTPGLTLRQTEGSNVLTYAIRGQTVEAFTGSPPAVLPYIDEVQLNTGGASTFYDLDSIQVLKGPQGTLFGRNSTGGAVLYTTSKPENDFGGYIEGRAGNLGLAEGMGAVNIPVGKDKVLLRVAFDVVHRDGYIHNLYYDQDIGAIDRQGARVSLTLKPTDNFENRTVVEGDHSGGSSTGASYLYSVNRCGAVNNGYTLTCAAAGYYDPTGFNAIFGPGAWNAYLAAHPKADPAGLLHYFETAQQRGPYYTDSPIYSRHDETDWFVVNTSSYDFGGGTVLKNIFGASRSQALDDAIETAEPFGVEFTDNISLGEYGNDVTTKQLSDELQLQGKALDSNLTYITGAYFQKSDTHIFYPQSYFDSRPFGITSTTADFLLHDKTEAIYAQGTYDLSSWLHGLSFTGGVRYTWEQVAVDHLPDDQYFTPTLTEQNVSFADPSWEAGLEYQATPELMAYVKTRGSFRSGGLNGVAPPIAATAAGGGDIFGPEHIKDVEAGMKFAGDLLGRPAHVNFALYQEWVTGVQRVEFPTVDGHSIAVTVNVPAAQVNGVELDSVFQPTPWLEVGLAGAYTNARYTENQTPLFGVNYVFGPYADAPKWTGTAFARFNLPIPPEMGDMSLRFDAYAQTAQYFSNTDASLTPNTKLPGYGLLNGRIDWNGVNGSNISLSLFAKNITDKAYFVGGLAQGASLGVNAAAVGEPRTYGAELKYKF